MSSASEVSTNHGWKTFRGKNYSRKFQKAKAEFAAHRQLFPKRLPCIYTVRYYKNLSRDDLKYMGGSHWLYTITLFYTLDFADLKICGKSWNQTQQTPGNRCTSLSSTFIYSIITHWVFTLLVTCRKEENAQVHILKHCPQRGRQPGVI